MFSMFGIIEYIFSTICIFIEFVLGFYEKFWLDDCFGKNDYVLHCIINLKPENPVPSMFDERYKVPFEAVKLLGKEIDRRVERIKKLQTSTNPNIQLDTFCTKWKQCKEEVDDLKIKLVASTYINGTTYKPLTKDECLTDKYLEKLDKLRVDAYGQIFNYKIVHGEYLNEIQEIEKKLFL